MSSLDLELHFAVQDQLECPQGSVVNPRWDEIEAALARVRASAGVVRLCLDSGEVQGPCYLEVYAEGGLAVPFLGVRTTTGQEIRSYARAEDQGDAVAIGGEYWHPSLICRDFGDVMTIFREFQSRRDVSSGLLV